jgi:glutamate/tyrosine decarboxylase-like PLP-dependent enzyme
MSLDPEDWAAMRALGHRMLDDMLDHLAGLRDGPVWQPPLPDDALTLSLPHAPADLAAVYETFRRAVLPYSVGNLHPGFMGWVHGGGTAVGMLAEMLAGGLNANCGGRNHAPIAVERQVIAWSAEMLGLPPDTAGLLVTGTSVANLIAVLVARRAALGATVRSAGVGGARLVAYTSAAAHGCIPRAMDMAGLGTAALRMVPTDARGGMDVAVLAHLIRSDREAGAQPFLVVGTAGSVDTGAIDDLDGLATVCRREGLWFHVDAAFGAMAMLSPRLRPLLSGVEQADSVAFDFHKWAQVPYDAGCILVRDPARALDTFAQDADYLRREMRGLAGGHPWPCDLGPDLSRGFRALKVWMTLSAYGADALGAVVERCCALAGRLGAAVEAHEALELLAPVRLNIVCFRVRALDDAGNAALVVALHEAGSFAPSTTRIGGRLAIRAAIVNHRTDARDIDGLLRAVLSASSAGQA